MAMTSDKPIIWGAAAAVVMGAIALYLYAHRDRTGATTTTPSAITQLAAPSAPTVVPDAAPAIEHPVPTSSGPDEGPLPGLDQSDATFHDSLAALPGARSLDKLLVADSIIRHIVVTVDNLPRKKVAVSQRPIVPTGGHFMTASSGDRLTIDPENYDRYRPFMEVVESVDVEAAVRLYYRFYPLFQSAFDDLGYQNAYFNDRLIALIEHLLETPDVRGPIALSQPNVMYLYADPALESLSPGQKTLIRMGPANETVIKARLRELETQLLAHQRRPS